ncbi:MAG: hypothetical protein GY820_01910 [Gammaproteobacteria bacterium]|nr:hypothetical protein [Gammaproteobacteria bacterium]
MKHPAARHPGDETFRRRNVWWQNVWVMKHPVGKCLGDGTSIGKTSG